MEEKKLSKQEEEKFQLQMKQLKQLEKYEPFQVWRELVADPLLKQIETDLRHPLGLSEAELKAKLMHLNSIKYLFYEVFDIIEQNN